MLFPIIHVVFFHCDDHLQPFPVVWFGEACDARWLQWMQTYKGIIKSYTRGRLNSNEISCGENETQFCELHNEHNRMTVLQMRTAEHSFRTSVDTIINDVSRRLTCCRARLHIATKVQRDETWTCSNSLHSLTPYQRSRCLCQTCTQSENNTTRKPTNWCDLAKRYAAQTVYHCTRFIRSKRTSLSFRYKSLEDSPSPTTAISHHLTAIWKVAWTATWTTELREN